VSRHAEFVLGWYFLITVFLKRSSTAPAGELSPN